MVSWETPTRLTQHLGNPFPCALMYVFLVVAVPLSAGHRVTPTDSCPARYRTAEWVVPFFTLLRSSLGFHPKHRDPMAAHLQTNFQDGWATECLLISTSSHFRGQTESGPLCAAWIEHLSSSERSRCWVLKLRWFCRERRIKMPGWPLGSKLTLKAPPEWH